MWLHYLLDASGLIYNNFFICGFRVYIKFTRFVTAVTGVDTHELTAFSGTLLLSGNLKTKYFCGLRVDPSSEQFRRGFDRSLVNRL